MSTPGDDATVLRNDHSLSGSGTGRGRGEASPPRVLKQRFVLDEKLGSGGMGTVFRAKDLRKVEARDRNPFVAVKVLNNDFREHPEAFIALQREAAKSQALAHRSIVTIYDFDKDGDVPFIIMELLEGQELSELLRAYPTGLPEEMAWSIIRCVCDGLEHAHEAGLVHADFKPGNVFVAPNHSAKILDFGIARAVQVNQAQGEETVFDPTRLAALTPAYASREMLDGSEAEVRDDLFALGVVIYLVLTGQHPYGRTPANQAAEEQRRAERPRGLARRRWRALERCLAFDRRDRPASVAELKKQLFEPSPWRSRTALVALAALAAVAATFALSGFKEEAAVQEAKVEVRQSTLVDSQTARLAALADEGAQFDAAWETKVAEEVSQLRSLLAPDAAEPEVLERIRQRYRAQVGATTDVDEAIELYRRGLQYGPLQDVHAHLEARLDHEVSALLDAPALTAEWMDALDGGLGRMEALSAGSLRLATLRLDTVDVLTVELEASLAAARFPGARRALEFLENYSFEPETLETLQTRVAEAEREFRARETARTREAARQGFRRELGDALDGACLRLDAPAAAAVWRRWVARYPAFEEEGRQMVGEQVGRCVAQLEALDRDRALALQQDAERLFGPLPGLEKVREDPCGASYLVGSGSQGGRRGWCADAIGDSRQGPRLVVVPGIATGPGASRSFAITRQEVSWAEFSVFCRATNRCEPAAEALDDLPVTSMPVTLAQEYAGWLSERTGFTYRLPTYPEWLHVAEGTEDPNRNCQVQLGAVRRGLTPVATGTGTPNRYGLVNLLGNVQEWVVLEGAVMAAGGAFRDPIAECVVGTLRPQGGAPDQATGFRLVREVW
ncbi:MAG: bifunctional serine/threonine-protein kinase/formylglycine-generating enzyme family protein [Pseudomonadales bacterium]